MPQWYVRSQSNFQVLFTFLSTTQVNPTSASVNVSTDLELDLGQFVQPIPINPSDAYVVQGGTFRLEGSEVSAGLAQFLSNFWPTGAPGEITGFSATGSGVAIEGRLSASFLPDPPGDGRGRTLPLALRLAQPGDPYEADWNDVADQFFPPNGSAAPSRHWILTGIPGSASADCPGAPGTVCDAPAYVSEFANRLARFHRESGQSADSPTFIAGVASQPPSACAGYLFVTSVSTGQNPQPLGLGWVFNNVNTQVTLGGSLGEANYLPRYLVGTMRRANSSASTPWTRTYLGFESDPRPDIFAATRTVPPPPDSSLILTLGQDSGTNDLNLLLTETPIQLLAGAVRPQADAVLGTSGYAAWLATPTGWLELSAQAENAAIDSSRLTVGAIRELINVGALARQLGIPGATDGLGLLVNTLQDTRVSLFIDEFGTKNHAALDGTGDPGRDARGNHPGSLAVRVRPAGSRPASPVAPGARSPGVDRLARRAQPARRHDAGGNLRGP